MSPLAWAATAGAVTATILTIAKKAQGQTEIMPKTPDEPPTYGEATHVALPVPDGWRRVTNAEVIALPELGAAATALRNTSGFTTMTYGTVTPFVASDGRTYATWVEQHYHEPGGVLKPWGLHHGVTLLAKLGIA